MVLDRRSLLKSVIIRKIDMADEKKDYALACAIEALEKFDLENEIASFIKGEFDSKYQPTWHCIVGRNFGSFVSHLAKNYIYFDVHQYAFLLFKSGSDS